MDQTTVDITKLYTKSDGTLDTAKFDRHLNMMLEALDEAPDKELYKQYLREEKPIIGLLAAGDISREQAENMALGV